MKVEINGTPHVLTDDIPDTCVDLLRERLDHTGTKLVCGAGVCGACTVQLDGQPVVSCLLPTSSLAGRSVVTAEGIGPDHPVARAFVAHAAMQCGYCTPGFVVEAAAFHDSWRATYGTARPGREQIAAALAGHLCRCGAYVEIYAAVAAACAGEFDDRPTGPGPRVEAPDKVGGRARYSTDVRLPGQLDGVIVRSDHAHARVDAIDLGAAGRVPGVVATVRLLAAGDPDVRYVGQEIAAVAATGRAAALAGAEAVGVRYEARPASVDPDAARQPDAAPVFAGKRRPLNAGEGVAMPTPWAGPNLRGPVRAFSDSPRAARRAVERARAEGDPTLVEAVFRTAGQSHTSFEPHVAVADWRPDGLTVHVSTQSVHELGQAVAKRFGLSPDRVRIVTEHVGGAFGSKLGLSPEIVAAVELSRAAGAPVRVELDRLEELSVTGYRPAAEIEMGLLPAADGGLEAVTMVATANAGVAVGSTIAAFGRLIYPARSKELADYDVVTNTPPGSPFRGPGGPLTSFALEQAVDMAAGRLGVDPIALRQRWDPDPLRQRLYRWAADLPAWGRRSRGGGGRFRHGVGVAAANWFYWWQSGCEVELGLTAEGGLVVSVGVQDLGTGVRSVLARVVADGFGVPVDAVRVRLGDSTLPTGPSSGGSRTTATVVPAAMRAVEKLKALLVGHVGVEDGRVEADGVRHRSGLVPWPDALGLAAAPTGEPRAGEPRAGEPRAGAPTRRLRAVGDRPPDDAARARSAPRPFAGGGPFGTATALVLRAVGGLRTGRGYTGAVHVAEVEVDLRLGRVRVPAFHCGLAVGRPQIRELAVAQAHGGVIQGLGYALYEHRELDPTTGRILSVGLEDYRIPGIADTPEITVHFDEHGFEHVPGGGVGIGEICTIPVAAAIANAVHDATGIRPYALPILPESILGGAG